MDALECKPYMLWTISYICKFPIMNPISTSEFSQKLDKAP